jgi:hypothetical protein
MTALPAALAAQKALIDARRAERITELRRHEAECLLCGDGPTEGQELRMIDFFPRTSPELICRDCFGHDGLSTMMDFTDLALVWNPITEAAR